MIRRYKKTCICCGKEYEYCSSCVDFLNKPAWMNIYHDENCMTLFNATSEYYAKNINKDELKEVFDKCDISDKEHFESGVLKAINEVYGVEESNTETSTEQLKDNTTYSQTRKNRKRN